MRFLFLLFIALPIFELWLLFKIGGEIGFLPTISLVLGAGALGIYILRRQSVSTMQRAQSRLQSGELPARELMEGFLIVFGGVLLLTPGLFTDVIALFLLLPLTRRALLGYLIRSGSMAAWTQRSGTGFTFMQMGGFRPPRGDESRDVFEGEFTRESSNKPLAGPDQDSTEQNNDAR